MPCVLSCLLRVMLDSTWFRHSPGFEISSGFNIRPVLFMHALGVPSFMARLPVLGGALRGISVRAITRVLEDSEAALEKASRADLGFDLFHCCSISGRSRTHG